MIPLKFVDIFFALDAVEMGRIASRPRDTWGAILIHLPDIHLPDFDARKRARK